MKKSKVIAWMKQETVLVVSVVLALLSLLAVPPDAGYNKYVDWRTIGLLFGLMAVMAGLQHAGVFRYAGSSLLNRVQGRKGIMGILVFLCFFFAMGITNDVALITFVPFSITVLKMAHCEKDICMTVVLQTMAANLGSMLTPLGNPQNLYLYGRAGVSLVTFMKWMLPFTVASGILLILMILLYDRSHVVRDNQSEEVGRDSGLESGQQKVTIPRTADVLFYLILFGICLLAVAKILDVRIMLLLVGLAIGIRDWKRLLAVDYSLLMTFLAFFVFIGNMGRVPVFRSCLQQILAGHECVTAVAVSQVVSNVPASLLLSGFTNQVKQLTIGVNLGGLGTLIASMASLISYKIIVREYPERKGEYFCLFTLLNVLFLFVLLVVKRYLP